MKTLNYIKPVCEVVELEREGYILCASNNNTATLNDMSRGQGFDDIAPEDFPDEFKNGRSF